MSSAATLQQPSVLWQTAVSKQQYGDHNEDVTLSEPVLITGITILPSEGEGSKRQVFKAWARDLNSPASARFTALFGAVTGPCDAAPAAQLFPTQHVVLRGRCSKATLQLVGYALSSAPAQIKAAAEARFCPLPDVRPVLSMPSTQQRSQQQELSSPAAAPSLPRPPGQVLPLRKIPPAFVLILTPLANFWGAGMQLPLPTDAQTKSQDLQACEQMATAVLAAKRGSPSTLLSRITSSINPYGIAVDWDGIRDSVLDMATYCCSALADHRVNEPVSVELAMAGVCAAILLAACQDTAVQFLSWSRPGRTRSGAAAVAALVSIPHQPQRLQDYGTGLVDLLMESCPAVACAGLQGAFDPAAAAGAVADCTPSQVGPGHDGRLQTEQQQHHSTAAAGGSGAARAGSVGAGSGGGHGGGDTGQGGGWEGTPAAKKPRLGRWEATEAEAAAAVAAGNIGPADEPLLAGGAPGSPMSPAALPGAPVGVSVDARPSLDVGVVDADPAGTQSGDGGVVGTKGSTGDVVFVDNGDGDADDDDDDGGLYDGLAGGGDSDRRSGSPASSAEGAVERQQNGHVEGVASDEEEEQLDFEDPETDGGLESCMDGDADGEGQDWSDEGQADAAQTAGEGGVAAEDSTGHEQQHSHSGEEEPGSMQDREQQQYSSDDGSRDQQQQDEDDTGLEDGEYHTEEEYYVEVEEDAPEPVLELGEALADDVATPKAIQKQPPVQQLCDSQVYNALLKLTLSPLQPDAAVSCTSVLRRLRAYHCLDVLQSTIAPMLAGQVNALLLQPPDFCAHVSRVAAAASDLATLVLQPATSRHNVIPSLKPQQQLAAASCSAWMLQQQDADADACVLQLMLGFRVMELLAAFVIYIGVHVCRLVQLQQQLLAEPLPSAEQQQQQMDTAEQQRQLCRERARLLSAIRALTASLTACAGGWCFLSAARNGLAALAAAVCPSRQVSLDGGPFQPDTSAPHDSEHGWQAERQQLLQSACGLCGAADVSQSGLLPDTEEGSAAAAAAVDLADSLQRLWLLMEATAELQDSKDLLNDSYNRLSINGQHSIDKLNAALLTMFKGGFASDIGEQSLVCALSSCTPALRQLTVLLEHCGKVQAAAACQQEDEKGQQGFLGDIDNLDMPGQDKPALVYGALYAPDLLLAVVSSPQADAITAWLPLTDQLAATLKTLSAEHERFGAGAARAAFPDVYAAGGEPVGRGGLPTAILPGGWEAAQKQREQLLSQLHGFVATAHRLVQHWRLQGDGSGAGSPSELLDWLSEQLPPQGAVDDARKFELPEDAFDGAGGHAAPVAVVKSTAAAAVAGLDGVGAVAGVPPPWGRDVRSEAAIEFMRNAACRSAALCALHLINMLLRGVPASIRTMARRAADRPRERAAMFQACMNPGVALNPDGSLGPQGPQGCVGGTNQAIDAPLLTDGFAPREVVAELLSSGVLEVLDRALRTATIALRAADADLTWSVQGGSQLDLLVVLQARTAAAALMRAACTTAAALLVHLTEADAKQLQDCSLLDALVCAHSTIVSCKEGLQACVPHPVLGPLVAKATDPALNPVQRLTADAAVASASVRCAGGRVLMLLEARQALAVCLRCWQLQGWWPDPVGALLGYFPKASAAAEEIAQEQAAARKAGDPAAPPTPAPRQGPSQQLSALLGLADLCPEEWPPRGASQVAARHRDAAQAEGRTLEGSPFERPSQMKLRGQLAMSLEAHWDRLENLITFGISCSTRLARLALVRMLARMCGVGGGTSPQLGPAVFKALCQRLEVIITSRVKWAAALIQIKASASTPLKKWDDVKNAVDGFSLQIRSALQVTEVLLPLCGAPSIKSVLTEYKAAGVLSKAVYGIVRPLPDLAALQAEEAGGRKQQGTAGPQPAVGPGLQRLSAEAQVLAGQLLQLIKVLWDPDISMNPWADSFTRELHDTPALVWGRAAVAYLLAACEGLNPTNMSCLSELLVGPSAAAGVRCLYDYAKGRLMLRLAARHWHMLTVQVPPSAASGLTQAELQTSAEWAAVAVESTQCALGPDPSHAASCAAVAQVLRELAASGTQEGEGVTEAEKMGPVASSIPRFVSAVKAAIAAHSPGGQDSQAISTLLCSSPLLLACDAATIDFWKASSAPAEQLQSYPAPTKSEKHYTASPTSCGQDWWSKTQLVGLGVPRVRSRGITEVTVLAEQEGQRAPEASVASTGSGGGAADVSEIPAIMARRGPSVFGKGDTAGSRRVSLHVDVFQQRTHNRQSVASTTGMQPIGMVPVGQVLQPMAASGPMGPAAAAAGGLVPMGPGVPGMGSAGGFPGMAAAPMGPLGPGMGGMVGPGLMATMGQMTMRPDAGMGQMQQQQQMLMQQQQMMMQQQQALRAGVGPGMMQPQMQMPMQPQHLQGRGTRGQGRRGGRGGRGGRQQQQGQAKAPGSPDTNLLGGLLD